MEFDCGEQCASQNIGRLVPLEESVGLVLAHDMTQIIPGKSKGPAFKKGHVVTADDIPQLARMGKRHLYAVEIPPDHMHENQAARIMADALCGQGVVQQGPPAEGKINLMAEHDGLFELDVERLIDFNMSPDVMVSTIHRHTFVKKGHLLAGTRAIPLMIDRKYVEAARKIAARDGGLLKVRKLKEQKIGIVVTGNEVAQGLIEDKFAPIVQDKVEALGSSVIGVKIAPDDRLAVSSAIKSLLEQGAEMIITTAGMSVDPDDITRNAISDAGGRDLLYGTPILPGAMFLWGRIGPIEKEAIVLGVPACALFYRTTILDLILPRALAGEAMTRRKLAEMAHGGFCQNCKDGCRFPVCGFGRGA